MSDQQSWMPKTPDDKPDKPKEKSERNFLVAMFMCFFFGTLGFHRFYAGKAKSGILMFFTLGGLGIWALIDFFTIITGNFTDVDGKVIKS